MKYTTFKKGGYGTGLITTTGGDVYGRVFLSRDPEGAMEAATKNYADLSITTLSASSFTTGTLAPARVPEFTGDIVKAVGGLGINYSDTGISTGTYPKISVDRKGRATGGGSLVESDLPDISFSKITSGKPTTLAGYGILDALSVNGGTLSGRLSAQEIGSTGESVINKEFVETGNLGSVTIPLGGIVYKGGKGPFFGFLRANGATASKTTYADLYGKIGDKYVGQTGEGSGKPWKQQYELNTVGDALGGWSSGPSLPGPLQYSQAIVTKNRVYLLGGSNGPGVVATVYTAPINADGTLGTWAVAPTLPGPLDYRQAIVTKNRVYLLGGHNGSVVVATVYTAPINSDGTLGTWATAPSLPGSLYASQAIVTKNRVYLLGGASGVASGMVYTAPINSDGTLGVWATAPSLPVSMHGSQAIVTKNRVYLVSGYVNNGYTTTSYTAPINPDGTIGVWTSTSPIPRTMSYTQAIVTKNRVYLLFGADVNTFVTSVYHAPVNADGTLGAWVTGGALPIGVGSPQVIITKNRIYSMGGWISGNGTSTANTYTATLSGGLNDYSPYYDGSKPDTELTHFRLPNIPQNNLELDAWIKA